MADLKPYPTGAGVEAPIKNAAKKAAAADPLLDTYVLEKLLGGAAKPLLAVATDLLAAVRQHHFSGIGLRPEVAGAGGGLRVAGRWFTGADTHDMIAKAREGDEAAWQTLLRYDEDDTRASLALRNWLRTADDLGSSF